MNPLPQALSAMAFAALVCGCASGPAPMAVSSGIPAGVVANPSALPRVQPGVSTRAEVLAALGPTASLRFDNGYEVWVYQLGASTAGTRRARDEAALVPEFLVLIAPSGVVARTRTRLPPIAR